MNVQDYHYVGDSNLKIFINNMNKKAEVKKQSKHSYYGTKLLIHKLKPEHPIWFIKIHAIENLINKI